MVPSDEAYQRTLPAPTKTVRAARSPALMGTRPRSQNATPTSRAPNTTASKAWSVAIPQMATKGRRITAGRGGNGIIPRPVWFPAASTTRTTSLKKSFPGDVPVAGTGYLMEASPWRNASACQTKWL